MFAIDFRSLIPARVRIVAALCLALLAPGCGGKKPVKTTPEVLVPSIESEPQPAPEAPPMPAENIPPLPEANPAQPPQKAEKKPKAKPHKTTAHKPAPPAAAETAKPEPAKPEPAKTEAPKAEPPKATTANSAVQITADVPRADVQSQTRNTEQLLRDSEAKLAGLGRSLSVSEQAMVGQARSYIAESSQAMRSGEIERAYNLAMKASLLANELAK